VASCGRLEFRRDHDAPPGRGRTWLRGQRWKVPPDGIARRRTSALTSTWKAHTSTDCACAFANGWETDQTGVGGKRSADLRIDVILPVKFLVMTSQH